MGILQKLSLYKRFRQDSIYPENGIHDLQSFTAKVPLLTPQQKVSIKGNPLEVQT